jgi:hypothetical protein
MAIYFGNVRVVEVGGHLYLSSHCLIEVKLFDLPLLDCFQRTQEANSLFTSQVDDTVVPLSQFSDDLKIFKCKFAWQVVLLQIVDLQLDIFGEKTVLLDSLESEALVLFVDDSLEMLDLKLLHEELGFEFLLLMCITL